MTKVRIDKWPVTGLARGSLNGKPFALAVGRVVDTTPAIAALLKEVSGAKVKVFKDDETDEPAPQPEPLVLNSEEVKPAETPADPGADEDAAAKAAEAEALAEAEAKAAERERVKAEKAAAKVAAAAAKKAAKKSK